MKARMPAPDPQGIPNEQVPSNPPTPSCLPNSVDEQSAEGENPLGKTDRLLLRISEAMKRIAANTPPDEH
jgi:hypothetical protein